MDVTTKQVLKYTLLPGILPRIRGLFSSGFSFIATCMAYVFSAVRLIPRDHPYLNPANTGRYGMGHVIGQAWKNLTFSKKNTDQIIIFFTMLAGIGLLFMQFFLLVAAFMIGGAQAGGFTDYVAGFFEAPDPTYDLAHIFLDRVFGLENIFGSCVEQGVQCRLAFDPATGTPTPYGPVDVFPKPYHTALHGMFSFYNTGLLIIALVVFLYYVFAIAGETAVSGTPFGRRFNHFWVPVRLLLAALLLMPTGSGLNAAQTTTLYIAKWGSSFATNGWDTFMDVAEKPVPIGAPTVLIARPEAPMVNTLVEGIWTGRVCQVAYYMMYQESADNYQNAFWEIISSPDTFLEGTASTGAAFPNVRAYIVRNDVSSLTGTRRIPLQQSTYQEAKDFTLSDGSGPSSGDQPLLIRIVFGEALDIDTYNRYPGNVRPLCGQVNLKLGAREDPGAEQAERGYYTLIQELWFDAVFSSDATTLLANILPTADRTQDQLTNFNLDVIKGEHCFFNAYVNSDDTSACAVEARALFNTAYTTSSLPFDADYSLPNPIPINEQAVARQISANTFGFPYRVYGWAGAGIWYNKIAEVNGAVVEGVFNTPVHVRFPEVMERVLDQRTARDDSVTADQRFNPSFSEDASANFEMEEDAYIALALYYAHSHWQNAYETMTASVFTNTVKALFGLEGLFAITDQEQTFPYDIDGDGVDENITRNVHPMAQLSMIGRSLIESAVTNFTFAAATGVGGSLLKYANDPLGLGTAAKAFSSFFSQVATIGLSIGFILFYIIPFLPFMYFFFAVGGWVKGLFEAIVGVPLWALSHIRIDGDGLPGPFAMNGYYLVFEVFVRPILIVFGFICSVVMFAALVDILNGLWENTIVPQVLGGTINDAQGAGLIGAVRSGADQLFFTVMYAIIVYMIGMSSFKLVDLIPNQILRWMGASVSTFAEQAQDPAENLVSYAFIGSQSLTASGRGVFGGLFGRNVA